MTWQPVLTDHTAFTYEALSRVSGLPVIAYVTSMEDPTRRQQGWTDTQVRSIDRRLIPQHGVFLFIRERLEAHKHAIHLFGSAFGDWRVLLAVLLAAWGGRRFFLVSEPYSDNAAGYFSESIRRTDQLKARLRPALYRMYMAALRGRVSAVFAISQRACDQFFRAGLPASKIIPFGYFVPSKQVVRTFENSKSAIGCLNAAYVGSLIPTKGIHTLLNAIALAAEDIRQMRLDAYGPGKPEAWGFDGLIARHCGKLPFGSVQSALVGYDVLILPSAYDGWGVVVNEALQAGVPVLCSDGAGASVLVSRYGAGAVFPAGDAKALASLLVDLASNPNRLTAMRAACNAAAEAIQPQVAAAFMWQVMLDIQKLGRASAVAPWYPKRLNDRGN